MKKICYALLSMMVAGGALAQEVLHNPAEVEALFKGATLQGVYLRTQSAYVLEFGEDGILQGAKEAGARWWVNEQGQYCREWLAGPLTGHEACMDVAVAGEQVVLFSNGKRIAEGVLRR